MKWVVTGASGFIGTNLSKRLLETGIEVCLIDDLSRPGVVENAAFLTRSFSSNILKVDVSDYPSLENALIDFGKFDVLVHLAGQVSLLSSIQNPRRDFEVNALGTLNVLEFVRINMSNAVVIGMSSNKIYGDLHQVRIDELEKRYSAPDFPIGFSEELPINFQGPYGCSKGTADQYLADYARIYGLKTISLRQSSVYGPFQKPTSDQGWVTFLMQEALALRQIQLNGEGKQVRDLLHVSDLVSLFLKLATLSPEKYGGQYNVGGGMSNALSILELFNWIEKNLNAPVVYKIGEIRPGDQKLFISDNSKITSQVAWVPKVSIQQGLIELANSING